MRIQKYKVAIHRAIGGLTCLSLFVLTAWFYYTHVYWAALLYTGVSIFIIYKYFKNYHNAEAYYGASYGIIICILFLCYQEYGQYKMDLRADKYGLMYNTIRKNLGIPIIPNGWHIKDKWGRSISWEATKATQGHESKYIAFDSLYQKEYEDDVYNLKSINDTTRTISIFFKYAKGKSRDSIFYSYHLKDTIISISRYQADSILGAAHIRKDY